ncbi:MAG: hypothetical protein WAM88_05290, partial [Nitrososphaeraceae archaeon]
RLLLCSLYSFCRGKLVRTRIRIKQDKDSIIIPSHSFFPPHEHLSSVFQPHLLREILLHKWYT